MDPHRMVRYHAKWYEWLEHMKKKDEKEKTEEMRQRKVKKMIESAEGSTGLLHKITKPTMWRRGVQILKKEEEEDARLLDRCEAERKEWAKHWQSNEEIQNMQDKQWRRLKEGDLEKASRLCKAKTGVGCHGFHPKVLVDLTKEIGGEIVEFLEKVEQCGKWRQQACTMMFFLIPENVTSERPIALMPTLIRWWEALRAPEVAKWQQKCRVEWDATDGRNGGAQRTVVGSIDGNGEILMGRQKQKIKELWPWSWIWRRHLSESAFLWSGLGRRISASQGKYCGYCAVTFSTIGVCNLKVCGRAVHDHHGYLARVQVELFAFTHCSAGCVERSHEKTTPL